MKTGCSWLVKDYTDGDFVELSGRVQFVFFRGFLLVLAKFSFRGEDWVLGGDSMAIVLILLWLQCMCACACVCRYMCIWGVLWKCYPNLRFSNFLKPDSHIPKKIIFICFIESPLKMMKNAFYLILKALFVLKIFKFLSWHFGHAEETA